ncbi:hypothetical protein EHS25_002694 [Saitozyma podzolica]|uniref:Uncharacterized protein n=1 Tax=Saitozyma podzolica TaxID=1890683 RepID=A0A427YD84_9TREE|nr:hypothetical protein EHS25_002694 [Saitozyma podzolica]
MFKKPLAHQSNATPLRSSARRQLLTSIFAQYPDLLVRADEGEGPSGVAAVSEKDLGRLILPEGIRSAAIETSWGVEGMLYSSPEGEPLWMSFGRNSKELIPTLYLLSLPLPHPPLPVLQLHHPLPPPILTGAPLFLPAVRHLPRPHLLPDVPEGAVVAFATSPSGDESVEYVGVGKVVSRGGLRGARDRLMKHRSEGVDVDEGKFCDVMCISGDHLWEMGSKPAMPTFPLPAPRTPLAPPPEGQPGPSQSRATSLSTDQASEGIKNMSLTDNDGPPVPSTPSQSADAPPLSPSEINTLLTVSLHHVLSTLQPSSFPMPASLLYSAHVLPCRPAYIPISQRDDVVIGKSEWKKLSKWMKEASKEGLLKIKETKGEVIVTGFDPSHPGIENHAPHVTLAEEDIKVAKRAAREATVTDVPIPGTTKQGKSKELVIEELWKPSGGAVSFWEACGVDKASLLPPSAIKTTADEYIAKHSLSDPRNSRMVLLDEELGRAVGVKKPAPGESLARDEVIKRLRAGVSWHVSVGGVIRWANDLPPRHPPAFTPSYTVF